MPVNNCPSCEMALPDNAASCLSCGLLISGGVFDFGIWRCISLESHSFWWRGTNKSRHVIEYSESNTITKGAKESPRRINKTKGRIFRVWLLGLLGTLGFQHFAVGRILTGSMRFLWGAFWWFMIILTTFFSNWDSSTPGILRVFFVALIIPSAIDVVKISLGKFRDVFRKYIT